MNLVKEESVWTERFFSFQIATKAIIKAKKLSLVSLPGPEVVAEFESETDVVTVDLFKADAKTEVVESFERSKP